jgi:hypothetical protein
MPPEVRRSLRNRQSAEVMSLAVLRILREHDDDVNPAKVCPQSIPDDVILQARADVKRSTIARFLEGAMISPQSGIKFRTVPDQMVGLTTQPVSTFINPLPMLFNPKQFAYLCALDQVSDEQDRELKPDGCLPTSILSHGLHRDAAGMITPRFLVTWDG